MSGRTRIIHRGNGHSYELDGQKVDGVTTILGRGVPKPWLGAWTARTIAEFVMEHLTPRDGHVYADELLDALRRFNAQTRYPKRLPDDFSRLAYAEVLKTVQYGVRDAAADLGSKVHDLAEQLSRGDEVDVPDELSGHVDSWLRFLDERQPTNAILERVVFSRKHRYMGTFDLIADFDWLPPHVAAELGRDHGRALLDIKTNAKGSYPDAGLQLAAYRYADGMLSEDGESEEPIPEVDWCGVIWVRADGYDIYPYRADEFVFRQFLYVKQVADFFADQGPVSRLKGDALPPPAVTEEQVA
jgi:hypothetical protein